jgi:hypothetical protein
VEILELVVPQVQQIPETVEAEVVAMEQQVRLAVLVL